MLNFLILMLFLLSLQLQAAETCSRLATINYQDVLVDVSSSGRGEGLRYYLQKDQTARILLDEYQDNNRPTWKSAAASTLGTAMILAGLLRTGEGENEALTSRNFLLLSGATLIAVSYAVSRSNQYNNEYLLLKSVEEYNKRNSPKIFFSPTDPKDGVGLGMGVSREF
jgi:hypothetical protein